MIFFFRKMERIRSRWKKDEYSYILKIYIIGLIISSIQAKFYIGRYKQLPVIVPNNPSDATGRAFSSHERTMSSDDAISVNENQLTSHYNDEITGRSSIQWVINICLFTLINSFVKLETSNYILIWHTVPVTMRLITK